MDTSVITTSAPGPRTSTMGGRLTYLAGTVVVTALLVAGCASDDAPEGAGRGTSGPSSTSAAPAPSSPDPTASGLARIRLPVQNGADVDGLVEVNGHDLAVHCTGSGEPTVVILHGWIDQPGITSYGYYGALRDQLKRSFRVCSYDRTNVGESETVAGTQTPEMVVADLDGLMELVGGHGPYVLIGQSAGGMVASAYAVAYPDKVAGIVMVDADFDAEITIEDMVPDGVGACDPANRHIDGHESLQMIDNCAMYRWAYRRRDRRPQVPLVYLASKREPWSGFTDFGPRWTRAIVPLQKAYAASWSPGKFEWVDSGHDIHVEQPSVVGDAVRWVVDQGSR